MRPLRPTVDRRRAGLAVALSCCVAAAAPAALATLAPVPTAYAAEASAQAAEQETFVEDGLLYLVTTAEGSDEPTVSVGTGTQPAADGIGDALADGDQTSVEIPATVEHDGTAYAVTQIAPFAFQGSSIEEVALPEGLQRIGQGAFQFCRSLQSVEIPSTVTLISTLAFFADNSLASVTFAEDSRLTEIGDGAFAIMKTSGSLDNTDTSASLAAISFPASLVRLGSYAFYGQSELASVAFEGDELYSISPYAFGYCTSLERIDIPTLTSTIERVGRFAFQNDTALTTVTFRGGVSGTQTTQAGNEFAGCTNIETVVYYDKKWNAQNNGLNPTTSVFGGDFSFGTGGFTDAENAVEYYTVYQYASQEEAEAGGEPTGYAIVAAGTPLSQISAGTCDFLESENFAAGTWAYEGGANPGTGLSDTLYAYPCDGFDLAYAGVSVDGAEADEDTGLPVVATEDFAGLAGIVGVCDASGTELTAGADYKLSVTDADGAAVDLAATPSAGTYTLTVTGTGSYTGSRSLDFELAEPVEIWTRVEVASDEWAALMQFATQATFDNASSAETPCTWAVVAAGGTENVADALSAAALAGALGAPVVLTGSNSLADEAAYEINRVGATNVVVVGGTDAVSQDVESALGDLYIVDKVNRIAGTDETGTDARVLSLGTSLGASWSGTCVIVASGDDAAGCTAAPYCYATSSPLLWADPETGLGDAAVEALTAAGIGRAVLVGSENALGSAVADQLEAAGLEVVRVAGDQDTAVSLNGAFSEFAIEEGMGVSGVAVGAANQAALNACAATLCGRTGSVLLYASDETYALLAAHAGEVEGGYVLGTSAVVSDADAARVAAEAAGSDGQDE